MTEYATKTEMTALSQCPRSRVMRVPKRASYDRAKVYELIDRLKTGHIAFVESGEPRSIPITLWRHDNALYLHTLNGGRLSRILNKSPLVCVSFAETTEWVLTKSAYHHSANYRSAVLFGHPHLVKDDSEFDAAFAAIINQIEAGRWDQVRPPNTRERKATALFRMDIDEGSYKSRDEGPHDDPEDLSLPVWRGTVPV